MVVLVCYDVSVNIENGQRRLNRVAKICKDYGQRVQNSVFECSVTPAQYITLKSKLERTINSENDSLRFYNLGKNWQNKLEKMGRDNTYDPDKDSIIF